MIAPRIRRVPAVESGFGVFAAVRSGADPERGPDTKVDSDLEVSYTRTCGVGSQAI